MSDAALAPRPIEPLRTPWPQSLGVLLQWNLTQVGAMLPLILVLQTMLAAGMIVGFDFLIPTMDPPTQRFLATGVPTVLLLMVGLVIVPQGVGTARNTGQFTYMRSLPVPRPLLLVADLITWLIAALPGVVIALLVARWHLGVEFSLDWPLLLAGCTLVTVMAASVGYALAVTFPPMLSLVLSQVLIFFVMLFSPINFPASQLPGWFQGLHQVLPFEAAAAIVRAGLASDAFDASARDLALLTAWTVAGVVISIRALSARR